MVPGFSQPYGVLIMNPLPRISSERLAALPVGSRLKLGSQIVKLTGRGPFTYSDGRTEDIIEFVDSRGVAGSHAESIFLASATEHLNSVMCDKCGQLRHPDDCDVRTIHTAMASRTAHFCHDKGCAERFFLLHPAQSTRTRKRGW